MHRSPAPANATQILFRLLLGILNRLSDTQLRELRRALHRDRQPAMAATPHRVPERYSGLDVQITGTLTPYAGGSARAFEAEPGHIVGDLGTDSYLVFVPADTRQYRAGRADFVIVSERPTRGLR